jgi:thiol-disulfide isomerase/thioredoxin
MRNAETAPRGGSHQRYDLAMELAWSGARRGPLVIAAVAAIGGAAASPACKRAPEPGPGSAQRAAPDLAEGSGALTWFRAALRGAGGVEVPFFLGIDTRARAGPSDAVIRVGRHEVRTPATFDGRTLRAPFPVHQTALEAVLAPDGTLAGTFATSWRAWGASAIPLDARPIAEPVLSALATVTAGAPIDLGAARTTWRLVGTESGVAKLAVEQHAPGELTGLLHIDNGNLIYLAGSARGSTIALAGFDGTSGYRVQLELAADRATGRGTLVGGHRLDWREELTATSGPNFELAMRPRGAGPDVKIGLRAPPELVALRHGPLVLEIGGSWCSTCRNAAPFFAELYREYHPRGLDMVTLLYELTGERELDAEQAERFRQTYGATWPVIPVHGDLDDFPEIMPSGLVDLDPAGFPVTLFLTADRTLVSLHAGFPSPDAPDEFRRVAAQFRATIERLLAPSP